MPKKPQQNIIFSELQDSATSGLVPESTPEVLSIKDKEVILNTLSTEPEQEENLISPELKRLEKQVKEIQDALDSINLMGIMDIEEKLKAINSKVLITAKLPSILAQLDDLRTKNKLKQEKIRGNKDISLLESGELDD